MIPDGYEGRNIDDRISETEGNLPGGDFVDALLSDTGRRVQAAAGMAEKPPATRFSETEEGYLSSRFDDVGGSVPFEKHFSKDTDILFLKTKSTETQMMQMHPLRQRPMTLSVLSIVLYSKVKILSMPK